MADNAPRLEIGEMRHLGGTDAESCLRVGAMFRLPAPCQPFLIAREIYGKVGIATLSSPADERASLL
jgi:hypothetical protein